MKPIKNIRSNIFGATQAEFGRLAGVSQAVVSRWENGTVEPTRDDMERIRNAAMARGVEWDDALFFECAEPARAAQ